MIQACPLTSWREVLVALCTYTRAAEFAELATALGERLLRGAPDPMVADATLCFVAAGDVAWAVECRVKLQGAPRNALELQSLVEYVMLVRAAAATLSLDDTSGGGEIAAVLNRYAKLLANEGMLDGALWYLAMLGDGRRDDLDAELRFRLYYALGAPVASAMGVKQPMAPFRVQNVRPASQPPVPLAAGAYGYASLPQTARPAARPGAGPDMASRAPSQLLYGAMPPPPAPTTTSTTTATAATAAMMPAPMAWQAPPGAAAPPASFGGVPAAPTWSSSPPSGNAAASWDSYQRMPTAVPTETVPPARMMQPTADTIARPPSVPPSVPPPPPPLIGAATTTSAGAARAGVRRADKRWNDPPPIAKSIPATATASYLEPVTTPLAPTQAMVSQPLAPSAPYSVGMPTGTPSAYPTSGSYGGVPPPPPPAAALQMQAMQGGPPPAGVMAESRVPPTSMMPRGAMPEPMPEPEPPMRPEHVSIMRALEAACDRLDAAPGLAPQLKRNAEICRKHLRSLAAYLRAGRVSARLCDGLVQLASALEMRNYELADSIQGRIMSMGSFDELGDWFVGVKLLVRTCPQAGV